MVKGINISQNLNKRFKTTRTINIYLQKPNLLQKTRGGGVKTAVGTELRMVSGNYHEVFGPVAMEMASYGVKIRHVFGDTFLTGEI
jgi:hypothetical protein